MNFRLLLLAFVLIVAIFNMTLSQDSGEIGGHKIMRYIFSADPGEISIQLKRTTSTAKVIVGMLVRFQCLNVEEDSNTRIYWFFGGQHVDKSSSRMSENDQRNRLEIWPVYDSGRFECFLEGNNTDGSVLLKVTSNREAWFEGLLNFLFTIPIGIFLCFLISYVTRKRPEIDQNYQRDYQQLFEDDVQETDKEWQDSLRTVLHRNGEQIQQNRETIATYVRCGNTNN